MSAVHVNSSEDEPTSNGAEPIGHADDATAITEPAPALAENDNEKVDEADEEGEEDREPNLKYTRLTSSVASLYRNGDSTSAFVVTGDKMVCLTFTLNV